MGLPSIVDSMLMVLTSKGHAPRPRLHYRVFSMQRGCGETNLADGERVLRHKPELEWDEAAAEHDRVGY